MKKTLLFTFILISIGLKAQLLAVYEFTGTGACPHQNPQVTTQPVETEFIPFTRQNVFCVSTQNVYNTDSWNTTANVNESEFIQFGLQTISCFRFDVDSIVFDFRNTQAGGTPTYHIRSSVDNFATDLATGESMVLAGANMLTDTIVFNPADFSLLSNVRFRIYLTNMGSSGAAFRIDDVKIYGSETFVGEVDYYADADGDGFGTGAAVSACTNPGGHSLNNLDCDDTDALINPNTFWYNDVDGDGYGNDLNFEVGCTTTFTNGVTNSDDCDDNDAAINPGVIWYQDLDNDGFGDDNTTEMGCTSALTNAVLVGGDCSDIASDLNPNTVWYEDADGDGYGNDNLSQVGCSHSFAVAAMLGGDCDDSNDAISPIATEICDGIDNNCNGNIDEGLSTMSYYVDNDGDGYGAGNAIEFCSDPGAGYSMTSDDCDDTDGQINPFGTDEPGNGIDENCDGFDEPFIGFDNDNDGYDESTDCDDNDASINPGATEIPDNGIDEDCDGFDLLTGIEELNTISLNLFPNPGTDKFFISTQNLEKGVHFLSIIDLNGREVLKSTLNITQNYFMEIPTSSFEKGVYQVVISNEKQISRGNWIKM